MTVADPIGAVITYLGTQTPVTDLAGSSLYSGELPRDANSSEPGPAVVVMPAGGPRTIGRAYQAYGDRRIDVITYGAMKKDAWVLALTVEAALTQLRRQVSAGVVLHWARPSAQPNFMLDAVTQWPAYLASYQLLAALTT